MADEAISAFPDASSPMGASDRVTGLQGGANKNFSQAQISPFLVATISLNQSDLWHLNSSPKTIIADPGAGKAIIVNNYILNNIFGTNSYDLAGGTTGFFYGNAAGFSAPFSAAPSIIAFASNIDTASATNFSQNVSAIAHKPLVFSTPQDAVLFGGINGHTVGASGAGYAPGDTGNDSNGDGNSVYVVDTVSAGGHVTAFHFSNTGTGYTVANGDPTNVLTGGGDGNFTINVTSITPQGDGTATITMVYQIVTVS